MSARRSSTKASRKSAREEASAALYVYCLGASAALAPVFEDELPASIEGGAKLELIAVEKIAAVASAVPLADYGEESLPKRLSEPAWTATRAMRHEVVVEHFARRATIVPLRFGTIYLRRDSVEKMLDERSAELGALFRRLAEREEWGVNVYADRAKLRDAVTEFSPRLRELAASADRATPGQAYLLRKKVDALRVEEARAETKRAAAEIENSLAVACDGASRLRLFKDESSEHGELVAKLAFLVRRDGFDKFRATAEALARKYAPLGLSLELTGPWPAYNFVAFDDEENKRAKGQR